MPDKDPEATTRLMLGAIERVGARAIISSGWARLGAADLPPRVRVIGPAPHSKLFPRMAAIVHHGGAGTAASSARAGVPQLVVPHLLDQYYWAERVGRLGLGPAFVGRAKLTEKRLAEGLRRCMSDEALRARARAFSHGVILDGLDRAVRLIEGKVVARPRAAG